MNNDYKKECWKRYLENQKYEKYDKEDLVDEIIELQQENQQLKKQKDDVVEYIKSKKAIINTDYIRIFDLFEIDEQGYTEDLLRMLGEIDVED